MKKVTLYSSSRQHSPRIDSSPPARPDDQSAQAAPPQAQLPAKKSRFRDFASRQRSALLVLVGALASLLLVLAYSATQPAPVQITQGDIDAAVLKTLNAKPLPSKAAKAYEAIRPSIVRVRGVGKGKNRDTGLEEEVTQGVGTGVVIVDKGVILTNLHVVAGAEKLQITFADGTESEATITGMKPEIDLAVIQANKIPDDLAAATMRSTQGLAPGDEVIAVGFPFNFGPSVSSGVISGLKREFRSPEGKRLIGNLIQFDAAANPGNSGGPLVTMEGEVIGIVTAIYNPTDQRVFVGIGFAVPIESAADAAGMPPF